MISRKKLKKLEIPIEFLKKLEIPREFPKKNSKSQVIIEGLISDWPAFSDPQRTWRGHRWDELLKDEVLDVGFDPLDGRMMHFGDDAGEPQVRPTNMPKNWMETGWDHLCVFL